MENINCETADKTLSQWMLDADVTDADLAQFLEVRRETVWRWRTKGFVPHARERKKIIERAGCNIVFGGA
ncbi:MAG: hypothetical protein V3T82_08060 [Nitrospinaceae bacterium]